MRVFLDTNILLDIIEARQKFLLAASNVLPDFEDMLQYKAAEAAGCDAIVTRDKKRHFPQEGIPVLSPEAFLNEYIKD